jgi:C1A family cysteine protease
MARITYVAGSFVVAACVALALVHLSTDGADETTRLAMEAPEPSRHGVPSKLYNAQTELFEEALSGDFKEPQDPILSFLEESTSREAFDETDNGPDTVATDSVNQEVYRFAKYQFGKAGKRCGVKGAASKPFKVTKVESTIEEGIKYTVHFNDGKTKRTMEVLREDDSDAHPHEVPGEKTVVRDSFTLGASCGSISPSVCGASTWQATEYVQFKGMSEKNIADQFTGDVAPAKGEFLEGPKVSKAQSASIPKAFDWRTHMPSASGMNVGSQGKCGSAYAFAATSALSDRFYLASKGRINANISPQSVMNCAKGCKGGSVADAYNALLKHPADPSWCAAYKGKKGNCGSTCGTAQQYTVVPQGNSSVATLGLRGTKNMDAMMYQIWKYGPTYMRMTVYSDFPYYRSGVYQHKGTGTKRGTHAVKVIGWGEDGSLKYWIAQNSWGPEWGEKGFVRIARGTDESDTESLGMFWAIPQASTVCPTTPACRNGGSYTSSCTCKCPAGFSGQYCDNCAAKCVGTQFSGGMVPGKCACKCANGFYDGMINGKAVKCGVSLGAGLTSRVSAPIATPKCVDTDAACPRWAEAGYCKRSNKYFEFTMNHCSKSCNRCDKGPLAQVAVPYTGKFSFHYGDMLAAVPSGSTPWNVKNGWAKGSVHQYLCGAEGSYKPELYCDAKGTTTLKIPGAGAYDVYYFPYLGTNCLGESRGWTNKPTKLQFQVCAGNPSNCKFKGPAVAPPVNSKALTDEQQAKVAGRVALDKRRKALAASALMKEKKKKFEEQEKMAENKILDAAKQAKEAEKKKEDAELKEKKAWRISEKKRIAKEVKHKAALSEKAKKAVAAKRVAAEKKNKVADKKRHIVVVKINVHKELLVKVGKLKSKLALEQARINASQKEANKEVANKAAHAAAIQAEKNALALDKLAMKKAAELAKKAALAQAAVKADVVKHNQAITNLKKAKDAQGVSDKAKAFNTKVHGKKAKTQIVHDGKVKDAAAAAMAVAAAKKVAVGAMEQAQCIIKDKRAGCPKWTHHCHNKKWQSWMMTHCTLSCGFSCTDLHNLAMGIVERAEKERAAKDKKERIAACPKYYNIVRNYAAYADQYKQFATQWEGKCQLEANKDACKKVKEFRVQAAKYEKNHVKFESLMSKLKCYQYKKQWIKEMSQFGSGAQPKHLVASDMITDESAVDADLFEEVGGMTHE